MTEKKESYLRKMLDERDEMTPKEGFNICTFDDFAPEGEMLTTSKSCTDV